VSENALSGPLRTLPEHTRGSGLPTFPTNVCRSAHRTTGVRLASKGSQWWWQFPDRQFVIALLLMVQSTAKSSNEPKFKPPSCRYAGRRDVALAAAFCRRSSCRWAWCCTNPAKTEQYVYFPTTAIVSLLYVMKNGDSAEIAVVGNEGIVGISLFMGGNSTPSRAVVQSAAEAFASRQPS